MGVRCCGMADRPPWADGWDSNGRFEEGLPKVRHESCHFDVRELLRHAQEVCAGIVANDSEARPRNGSPQLGPNLVDQKNGGILIRVISEIAVEDHHSVPIWC